MTKIRLLMQIFVLVSLFVITPQSLARGSGSNSMLEKPADDSGRGGGGGGEALSLDVKWGRGHARRYLRGGSSTGGHGGGGRGGGGKSRGVGGSRGAWLGVGYGQTRPAHHHHGAASRANNHNKPSAILFMLYYFCSFLSFGFLFFFLS